MTFVSSSLPLMLGVLPKTGLRETSQSRFAISAFKRPDGFAPGTAFACSRHASIKVRRALPEYAAGPAYYWPTMCSTSLLFSVHIHSWISSFRARSALFLILQGFTYTPASSMVISSSMCEKSHR